MTKSTSKAVENMKKLNEDLDKIIIEAQHLKAYADAIKRRQANEQIRNNKH